MRERFQGTPPAGDVRHCRTCLRQELLRLQDYALLPLLGPPLSILLHLLLGLEQDGEDVRPFRAQQGFHSQQRAAAGQEAKGLQAQRERLEVTGDILPVGIPNRQGGKIDVADICQNNLIEPGQRMRLGLGIMSDVGEGVVDPALAFGPPVKRRVGVGVGAMLPWPIRSGSMMGRGLLASSRCHVLRTALRCQVRTAGSAPGGFSGSSVAAVDR